MRRLVLQRGQWGEDEGEEAVSRSGEEEAVSRGRRIVVSRKVGERRGLAEGGKGEGRLSRGRGKGGGGRLPGTLEKKRRLVPC